MAGRHPRHVVHAVDLADAEAVEHAVLDHGLGACAALFGRLEDHHRGAIEIACLGKVFGGAEKHGGVAVMAAGVHLAGVLRGVGLVGLLVDRKRVHIGAHADDLAAILALALDDADDARSSDAAQHLVDAEGFQFLLDDPGGAVNVVEKLRMFVEITTPAGDFGFQGCDALMRRHGQNPSISQWIKM